MQLNVNSSTIWQILLIKSAPGSEWGLLNDENLKVTDDIAHLHTDYKALNLILHMKMRAAAPEILISLLTNALFCKQQSFG